MKTLIIGSTGNIGTQIVQILASENHPVIAAGRDLEKTKKHHGNENTEYRRCDLNDISTWETALEDVREIFLVVPPGSASEERQQAFFQKANEVGVQHIVYSSGRTTGPVAGSPLNRTESFVKNSGCNWTILRPGWFMQNFFEWIGFTIPSDDAFYLPAGHSKTAFIDVRDIGATAAEILKAPTAHHGKTYDLTCLKAIDHSAVARHISEAAGRTIHYVPMQNEDFIEKMIAKGRPRKAAEKMAWLYSFVTAGKEADVSLDAKHILQRQPIDFKQFTIDHAHKWQK
ncbi:MAG: NmrA family NAD(P)-binding protein [Bacteroidota bacterium]